MRAYRTFESKHEATAFTGEGARLYGGRWNSVGVPIVYVVSSFALALLEIMANARPGRVPPDMVYSVVGLPDHLVETLDVSRLPTTWYKAPAPPECQAAGDEWVRRGSSVALLVPSAIARIENNVLLNPNHRDFAQVGIGATLDMPINDRLRR